MTLEDAKNLIPIYVNIKDIQVVLGVCNRIARRIFQELKEENREIPIPYEKKIPIDWVINKYGKQAMKNKKKDA